MARKKKITVVKFNGRTYTVDDVRNKLVDTEDPTSKVWRYRALMRLYSFQTPHEQAAQRTAEFNGQGFNKIDVQMLTDIAQRSERYGKVTDNQDKILVWKLPKYSKQIFDYMVQTLGSETVEV